MVIFDHVTKKVRMVIGGSGGSKIISALAKVIQKNCCDSKIMLIRSIFQSIVRSLIFHDSIKKAIDAPMIHNQFTPDITQLDDEFPINMKNILESEYLQKFRNTTGFEGIIQGVNVLNDGIYACGDYRRKTDQEPSGF